VGVAGRPGRPGRGPGSYLGSGDAFDTAIAEFSELYADQSDRDHAALVEAIGSGRIPDRPLVPPTPT
jgi:hypothetical protein